MRYLEAVYMPVLKDVLDTAEMKTSRNEPAALP
jgi:hypothetical protein